MGFLGQRTYVLAWYVAWIDRLLDKEGAGNVFGWCLVHCSKSSARSHSMNSRNPYNPWIQVRGRLKGIPNTCICIDIISSGDRHLRRSAGGTTAREGGREGKESARRGKNNVSHDATNATVPTLVEDQKAYLHNGNSPTGGEDGGRSQKSYLCFPWRERGQSG